MTRRAVPLAAGWYSGLFAAFFLSVCGGAGFLWLIAGAAALGLAAILLRVGFLNRALVVLGAFAVAVAYSAVYTNLVLKPVEALDGETAEIRGKVVSSTEGDRSLVVIKGRINGIPARAAVYISGFSGSVGDGISAEAVISKLEDTVFFSGRRNYLPDGVLVSGRAESYEITPRRKTPLDAVREYSDYVSREIRRRVGGEAGELTAALVTGDRSGFSDSLRLKLNRAGVGHIAAVSGIHVSVIAAAVLLLCDKLGLTKRFGAILTEASAVMFVIFSGARVSAIRSAIMLSVAVAATLLLKRQDALNTVCVTALLMTLRNPYAAADMSASLSLAGVTGAAAAAPAVIKEYNLKGKISRAICVSACAVFTTLPFTVLWFDEISLAAPFSNLFAVPLCTMSLVSGMLFALSGCKIAFFAEAGGMFSELAVRASEAVGKLNLTIPLGNKFTAAALIALFTAVCAAYLVTKNTKKAARTALALAAVFLSLNAAAAAMTGNRCEIFALCRGENSGVVLRKGAECIIIDFDGGLSGTAAVLERYGIGTVAAAIPLSGGEAAQSAYLQAGAREIILPADTAAVENAKTVGEGARLEAFGAVLEIVETGAEIKITLPDGSTFAAAKGRMPECGRGAAFLKGLTVIRDDGGSEVFKGDCCVKALTEGGSRNGNEG